MSRRDAFRPAYDLARARPLFIDAWPAAWAAHAPATTLLPLTRDEMAALGAQIMGMRPWFGPLSPAPLHGLRQRLATALAALGVPAFVRLSSRSPKDSLRAMRHGLQVQSADDALALVLEGSERAAHDLRACLDAGVALAFVIRPWLTFEPWQEWRCVMRARSWAGASAPLGLSDADAAQAAQFAGHHAGLLRAAVADLAAAAPVDDAVFELLIGRAHGTTQSRTWTLLDANPLLPQTGLGWFESVAGLDEGIRCGPPPRQSDAAESFGE